MRTTFGLMAAALFFCLLGCAATARQVKPFDAVSFDYIQRLRWQDWIGVARYLPEEERESFIQKMREEKDLHITDVRQEGLEMVDGGKGVLLRLAVDYYRLPSVTIRTTHLRQEWTFRNASRELPGGWQLLAPLPPLP